MKECTPLHRAGLAVIAAVMAAQIGCADDDAGRITPPGQLPVPPPTFVEIVNPAPCEFAWTRPPAGTYDWRTQPGKPKPVDVRWILLSTADFGCFDETAAYIRNHPDDERWSHWQPFWPPDLGTSWTSDEMAAGEYVFAVHGRDADRVPAEEFDFDRNMRRIVISEEPTPSLEFSERSIPNVGRVICWTTKDGYCNEYTSYRYAWDPLDLDNIVWTIDWTPFDGRACTLPVVLDFGTHTLFVEMKDRAGRVDTSASLIRVPFPGSAVGPVNCE